MMVMTRWLSRLWIDELADVIYATTEHDILCYELEKANYISCTHVTPRANIVTLSGSHQDSVVFAACSDSTCMIYR